MGLSSKDVANNGRGNQERLQELTALRNPKKMKGIIHNTGLGSIPTGLGDNKLPTALTTIPDVFDLGVLSFIVFTIAFPLRCNTPTLNL